MREPSRRPEGRGFHTSGNCETTENDALPEGARPRPKGRRRVTQAAPEGSDTHPFDPPESPRSISENDDRLRADMPPHWG